MKIKIGHITCPDWLDPPVMILIPAVWLLFVIGVAIIDNTLWLLLLFLCPRVGKRTGKSK